MKEIKVETEKKHRDHTKTGKLAKKREDRRLEAIERQVRRIKTFEEKLEKAKDKKSAQEDLTHAQFTLQTIRGGKPHDELTKEFKVKIETVNNNKEKKVNEKEK